LSGQLELKQEVPTTITMWMDKTNRIIVDDRIYTYQNDKAKYSIIKLSMKMEHLVKIVHRKWNI
jgi:hypothetical protein